MVHLNVFVCCLDGDLLCARAFGNGAIISFRVLLIEVKTPWEGFKRQKLLQFKAVSAHTSCDGLLHLQLSGEMRFGQDESGAIIGEDVSPELVCLAGSTAGNILYCSNNSSFTYSCLGKEGTCSIPWNCLWCLGRDVVDSSSK